MNAIKKKTFSESKLKFEILAIRPVLTHGNAACGRIIADRAVRACAAMCLRMM
jgi:hypothetical protein